MSVTYAVYGCNADDTREYIGTYDDPPTREFIERWQDPEDGYPSVVVSRDELPGPQWTWVSIERRHDRLFAQDYPYNLVANLPAQPESNDHD